eukprot:3150494-Prymnesium_polylepis.1
MKTTFASIQGRSCPRQRLRSTSSRPPRRADDVVAHLRQASTLQTQQMHQIAFIGWRSKGKRSPPIRSAKIPKWWGTSSMLKAGLSRAQKPSRLETTR